MKITLTINETALELETTGRESLLSALRSNGYFGVKQGCETGECGACTVLVNGTPTNACVYSASQADGKSIETIEDMGR